MLLFTCSTEQTYDRFPCFRTFPSLPYKVTHHCLVSLRNGGDMFFTGGKNHSYNGKETNGTFIYRMSEGNWMQVPDMPTPRYSKLALILQHNQRESQQSETFRYDLWRRTEQARRPRIRSRRGRRRSV